MGVLKFDAYAVLAEIEDRQPSDANPANAPNPSASKVQISTISRNSRRQIQNSKITSNDQERYLALLRDNGPQTYGAVAIMLGWGATRAWQAEARLRAAGMIRINETGKAQRVNHPAG